MNALLRAETTNEMLLFDDKEKPKDLGENFLEKRSNKLKPRMSRPCVNQTQAKLVKGECFHPCENFTQAYLASENSTVTAIKLFRYILCNESKINTKEISGKTTYDNKKVLTSSVRLLYD